MLKYFKSLRLSIFLISLSALNTYASESSDATSFGSDENPFEDRAVKAKGFGSHTLPLPLPKEKGRRGELSPRELPRVLREEIELLWTAIISQRVSLKKLESVLHLMTENMAEIAEKQALILDKLECQKKTILLTVAVREKEMEVLRAHLEHEREQREALERRVASMECLKYLVHNLEEKPIRDGTQGFHNK